MITKYIRNTSSFDSHLYTDEMRHDRNARFQVHLRVCLQQGPVGTTAAPGGKPSLAFENNEWVKLKKAFAANAEKFWSGQYWLVPTVSYPELQVGGTPTLRQKFQCNAFCELYVYVLSSPGDAHRVVNLFKVAAADEASFPTDSANMTKGDVQKEKNTFTAKHGGTCTQSTLAHEAGHLLGLDHIGVYASTTFTDSSGVSQVCTSANQNTQPGNVCYMGRTKAEDCSVMGIGSGLSLIEGRVWHERIASHTGITQSNWRLSRQKIWPKKIA